MTDPSRSTGPCEVNGSSRLPKKNESLNPNGPEMLSSEEVFFFLHSGKLTVRP